jgi:hypothetical protein
MEVSRLDFDCKSDRSGFLHTALGKVLNGVYTKKLGST